MRKLNVLVAGSTGYIGVQLVNILLNHRYVKIKYLCGNSSIGKNISVYDSKLKSKKLPKIVKFNYNFLNTFDKLNGRLKRSNPYGEVFLNQYNLYKNKNSNNLTKTIIYLLSESDSTVEVIDVVTKYNLKIEDTIDAIKILEKNKIAKLIQ